MQIFTNQNETFKMLKLQKVLINNVWIFLSNFKLDLKFKMTVTVCQLAPIIWTLRDCLDKTPNDLTEGKLSQFNLSKKVSHAECF